ncbi:GTP pyrophosphokinase [Striga asiatica]|uniref:GTP pyrophosphokinase n=1 Tax=Striga asiatica TaxID=4170 RepID=A0A5A7QFN9_STRAF|nr:GTP pyrophosphokinase [Striga asiatica]
MVPPPSRQSHPQFVDRQAISGEGRRFEFGDLGMSYLQTSPLKISHIFNFLLFLLFFLLCLLQATPHRLFPKHFITFQNTKLLLTIPSQELNHLEHRGPSLGLTIGANKPDQNNPFHLFLRVLPLQSWIRQLIEFPLVDQRQGPFSYGPPKAWAHLLKGLAARGKLEQEDSKAINVTSLGGLAKHGVLGSKVAEGSFDLGGHVGCTFGYKPCKTEVRNLGLEARYLRNALTGPNSDFHPPGPVEMRLGRMLTVKMRHQAQISHVIIDDKTFLPFRTIAS